ncbi:TRAP-type mannitol/chloroaromatic compound transport system, large permease component [Hoeflea sp. IMCC20628]|uniref:TRAP transporter large permease n=1 Tax=Hoeflea sp. IMCC20628 TaxID=1620421 RepID=UPI00063AFEA6|nr:TRAP transporter large permease subunit [Hoeflea sp. IMCC20628]AKH98905.1 TRAP-type mannitol/chloroaromatic compound transport system, large permease component [Hoeflea sp. IMCC20628]
MFDFGIALPVLGLLVVVVFLGLHIAVALAACSLIGLYIILGSFDITMMTFASTAFQGLRGYTFAALPLFMIMGEFISRSGAAQDLYVGINRALKGVVGRLALATVLGNAVFAFLTGVSIAAAAAFTRIAYPQMRAMGYDRGTALGVIAGSSCLGMLIPPSNLMILWAILVEESIGRLFLAGIIPGLMLATLFVIYVMSNAYFRPHLYGEGISVTPPPEPEAQSLGAAAIPSVADLDSITSKDILISTVCMGGLIASVLGGIWFGAFTATEAAGVGSLLALAFAIVVKGLRLPDVAAGILQVAKTAAPLLIMILMALLYSRTLALTGIGNSIEDFFSSGSIPPWAVLVFMVCIWFLLGMLIDSKSIMLLTVPIFAPLGELIGYNPIAFAIIGILAIEAGILTPPFGLIVYTVKAAAADDEVSTLRIFAAATPYWICLLIVLTAVAIWPGLATYIGDITFNKG